MNGPDHYRRAEQIVADADAKLEKAVELYGDESACTGFQMAVAAAQVHATLALAAAQALTTVGEWFEVEDDATAWCKATQVPSTGEQ